MATGLIKGNTIVGLIEESTEGTYVAPSGATKYLQVLEGIDLSPAREIVDRNLLTASPGKETPRMGMKSVSAVVPVEFKSSGTAGGTPDYDVLIEGALGASRSASTETTTKSSGNTSTNLAIEDADISKFAVGDMVVVKKSGAYEMRPVSAVNTGTGTAALTLPFALTAGSPGNSVVLSKFRTYYTASTGHNSISLSVYWGNEIRDAAIGCKVTEMSLENWQPGQVASWNFSLEGTNFTSTDGAAPHTPTYDTGIPPIVMNACVWRAGTEVKVSNLSLSLSNELGFLSDTCSPNGKTASRVKGREISGSFNPYKDDTSTTYFDNWVAGTEFSLFAYAYNPSATTGEFTLGSAVGIWLPQCICTEFKVAEVDGILVDQMSFRATRGSAGTSEEMYVGLV